MGELEPEQIAQPAKFHFPLELVAKLECLLRCIVVKHLELVVVPKYVKHSSVSLPEELNPGREQHLLSSRLGTLVAHHREQDRFRGLRRIEILNCAENSFV